ncbi:Berberine bridge enzyme-like 26, partial [Linum perenne]
KITAPSTPPFLILNLSKIRTVDVDGRVQVRATVGEAYYHIYQKIPCSRLSVGLCSSLGVGGHITGDAGSMMSKYGLDVRGNFLIVSPWGKAFFGHSRWCWRQLRLHRRLKIEIGSCYGHRCCIHCSQDPSAGRYQAMQQLKGEYRKQRKSWAMMEAA